MKGHSAVENQKRVSLLRKKDEATASISSYVDLKNKYKIWNEEKSCFFIMKNDTMRLLSFVSSFHFSLTAAQVLLV